MMPERLLTVALLSSAVAAGLAVDLTAQGGRGAAARVGNDAMAMLRSAPITANPGEAFDIRESAPAGFPVDLLPEAAVVNVSSVSPSLSVVVATVESGRPFNRVQYEWALGDHGWISTTSFLRGFSSGVTEIHLCRGTDFASLRLRRTPAGDWLIRASLGRETMRACAPSGTRNFTDVPIPSLLLPEGIRYMGGMGSGGGLDEMSSRTRFETAMSLDALMGHFIPQFTEVGWKLESGPASDGVMIAARFSGASRSGDAVTAQLIITALAGTPFVDAVARFIRHKPVRVS